MATRLLAHNSTRVSRVLRLSQQHYHVSARREIGPILVGLGVFVAANAAAYALRAMERKSRRAPGGPISKSEEDSAKGSNERDGASSTGQSHPLFSATNTSLGVDLGSSSMRIAALLARSSLDPSDVSTSLTRRAEVLESRTGHRTTPAFVNVDSSEAIVGEVARARRFSHSSTTVWNLQQLIEDAYAGRQTNAKATTFTAWNEAALEDGRVAHGGGINSEDGSNSAAKAPSAFSLDHVVLAPPGVHDRNFYASNGLPPLRASGVHGALWQDLLSGACGRLGGGREGADLMNSSTLVVSLPRSMPERVRGAYLLAAMHDANKAAQRDYDPVSSLTSSSSTSPGEEEENGAVVVGCIDDAAAALLSSIADGTLPSGAVSGSSSAVLVVDVGATITQATVFNALPVESFTFGHGFDDNGGHNDNMTFPPPPDVLGASASRGVGFGAVVGAVVNHVADQFAKAHGVDLRQDYLAHERLETAVEEAAHILSKQAAQTSLNLPFVAMDMKTMQPLHLNDSLGRAQLAHVAKDPLGAIAEVAAQALTSAGLSDSSSSSRYGDDGISDTPNSSTNERAKLALLVVGGGARSGAVVDAVRTRVAAMMASKEGSSPNSSGRKSLPSDEVLVVVPAVPEEAVVLGAALAAKAGWVS